MNELIEQDVDCPYCGEKIEVLIDQSQAQQDYVEDCQVCCQPIIFVVAVGPNGDVCLNARSENE